MPSVASASDDDVLLQDVDEYFDAGDDASNVTGTGSDNASAGADAADEGEFFDAARAIQGGEDSSYLDFPAHAAAFDGDVQQVLKLLEPMSAAQRVAFDPLGNTVLHVAVLKRRIAVVQALLDFGFPCMHNNAGGWLPLDEAVALRHRQLVEVLYYACMSHMKGQMRAKRADLLQSLRDMPDHHLSLSWELGSPVFGFILSRYAPHDTYQVWKRGVQIRVDGSLMGIDEKTSSLIPRWKRGDFSLLFDGRSQPASIKLVDRAKKTYIDVQAEKKASRRDKETEVQSLLSAGAGKTKIKTTDFHFKPAKTLFGNDSTEKVAGWRTRVYEATGRLAAVSITKAPLRLPDGGTFEEYCAMTPPLDARHEVPIDPLSTKGMKLGKPQAGGAIDSESDSAQVAAAAAAAAEHSKKGSGRKFTARCWMAESFPISLQQLLPILDVIGEANKHLKKAGRFMAKYGSKSLFPIKLQVPLLFTVFALVQNRTFRLLKAGEEAATNEFYELPPGSVLKPMKRVGALGLDDEEDFGLP